MTHALIKDIQKNHLRNHPEIKTGYTVRVHQKIKEGGKERVQIFEGLVIKVSHGQGMDKTFTVRRIVSGIGVEKIFPMNSATIAKVEVIKKAKIRRAKLYYMRERSGKSARLKEEQVNIVGDMKKLVDIEAEKAEANKPKPVAEEVTAETPVTEAAEQAPEKNEEEAK